jgi:hypothetical protein
MWRASNDNLQAKKYFLFGRSDKCAKPAVPSTDMNETLLFRSNNNIVFLIEIRLK